MGRGGERDITWVPKKPRGGGKELVMMVGYGLAWRRSHHGGPGLVSPKAGGHLGEVCVIAGVVAPHHGCQEVRRGLG